MEIIYDCHQYPDTLELAPGFLDNSGCDPGGGAYPEKSDKPDRVYIDFYPSRTHGDRFTIRPSGHTLCLGYRIFYINRDFPPDIWFVG
jgi:hypothetical protein